MEENENILLSVSTKRRESIFGDGDAINLDTLDSKVYPPDYGRNLETEINLWTQEINWVQQECKKLKSDFNPNPKITVNQNIISKEECEFFNHSLYYDYLKNIDKFCNKIQCAREMQKQKTHALRQSINRVDEQLKSLYDSEHWSS